MRTAVICTLLATAIGNAYAACPTAATMADIARHWQEMTPATGLDKDMNQSDGQCGQKLFLLELAKLLLNPSFQFAHRVCVAAIEKKRERNRIPIL